MIRTNSYYIYGKCRGYLHWWLQDFAFFHTNINWSDQNEIHPHVYVGNIYSAFNLEELKKNNITHVINCVSGLDNPYEVDFNYFNVDAIDDTQQDIGVYFAATSAFIEEAILNNGNVFIHCICGVSRSVCIASAYIIKKEKTNVKDTIDGIALKRAQANPNPYFREQLHYWYEKIAR
uniref:Dual specificity phosphatase, catalytic domain protein n=1 Tax=Megaviridae environmental sample TaxID=1737588 RepID=A0A5J6VL43_9VIRU|nr:MAG: dual specificity phosphatase, catalytic domain protein [Megaviridae environmental sample]